MISPQETLEIQAELAHSHDTRAAVPEILKVIQRHRGYVSDESLQELSAMLGVTADELDSVATFYSLIYRRPVGRHVILLCDSVSCWITGYHDVLSHLRMSLGIDLGQTTSDGRFTLLTVACLGACDQAPAMMIDDELHGNLNAARIDGILATYA